MKRIRGDSDFLSTVEEAWFESTVAVAPPCGPGFDPVDQATTLWTTKTGSQGGLVAKRSRCLWMSEDPKLLQLDPLAHHFDPEGQAPTLWVRTIEPEGQRVPEKSARRPIGPDKQAEAHFCQSSRRIAITIVSQ